MPRRDEAHLQQSPQAPRHAKDWDGDGDPADPRNWPLRRAVTSTAAVSAIAFVSTLAASIYAPAVLEVSRTFHVSTEVALLPLSLFSAGLAFGPIIGSPLSETFGRKALFLTTTPIFALFILGSGFSQSIASLIICRFFAGVFASPAISNASATITDYSAARYRAVPLAFYYSIPFFGAVLGPLIGGLVLTHKSWRWTQWTVLFFLVTFYVPVLFIHESYKKTILQRRAKRLNLEGPPPLPRASPLSVVKYYTTKLFARPIHMLFTEPIVTCVCAYGAFQFGVLYLFIVASPYIFATVYHFDLTSQSLSFLGFMTGTIVAPVPLILIDHFIYQPRLSRFYRQNENQQSKFPPENRLYPALIASPLLPVTLLLFAWTTRPQTHWIWPICLQTLTVLSSLLIYSSTNLYMMDTYGPLYGASASAAAMLSRYTLSAAFPLFALPLYRALGVGWATTLLGLIAVLMAPIPWVFYLGGCGARIRARSRYEMSG